MSTITDLYDAIIARANSQMLINLTNNDGPPAPASINATRLIAACQDAIGKFRLITGITEKTENYTHISCLCVGVLAYLEMYKSRDSAMSNMYMRQFFAECNSLKELRTIEPYSEDLGVLADMDTSRNVFKNYGSMPNKPLESSYFGEDE